jgi:hypothetical protein
MAGESDRPNPAGRTVPAGGPGWTPPAAEFAAILLVFAAAAAWPVPDVNETVYLTKARHFIDPLWGGGDWFLETPDAHAAFYLLIGPIMAAFDLERAAWVGRWLGWLALAIGFRHAVLPLLASSWSRILAAAMFSLALRHTTASGEWVIGGCEAKVFAWALALPAIGELVRGRFARAWLLLGGATALHPIVGGWGLIALVMVWLRERRGGREPEAARRHDGDTPVIRGTLVLAGLALAAWGVVPALALSAGVDAAGRAAANRIYVVDRLPHHLLLRTFPEAMIARHLLAILIGTIIHRLLPPTPARTRLAAFREASLAISLAGCGISLLEPLAPDLAIGLLRFYWFRLADVIVPFALATNAAAAIADDETCTRLLGRPAVVRAVVIAALAADLAMQSRHWPLPGRTGLAARTDAKVDAAAWADICDWVRGHTDAAARFLTPRGAASFTWRTGRAEVVAWKNSPQDAVSLLEWRRRIGDCFSADGTLVDMERSTAALGAGRMREVAERYGADHAIVPLCVPDLGGLPFERLHANAGYAVYRLRPAPSPRAAP